MDTQTSKRWLKLSNIIFTLWKIICIVILSLILFRYAYKNQFEWPDFNAIQLLLWWGAVIVLMLSYTCKHLIIMFGRIFFSNATPENDGHSWEMTRFITISHEDRKKMPQKNLPKEIAYYEPILYWCDNVVNYSKVYQSESLSGHFIHSTYEREARSEYWFAYSFSLPQDELSTWEYITIQKDFFNQPNYQYYKALALPILMMMIDGKSRSWVRRYQTPPLIWTYQSIAESVWIHRRLVAIWFNLIYWVISYFLLTYILEKYRVKTNDKLFEKYFDIKSSVPDKAKKIIDWWDISKILDQLVENNIRLTNFKMRLDGDTKKWLIFYSIIEKINDEIEMKTKWDTYTTITKKIANLVG